MSHSVSASNEKLQRIFHISVFLLSLCLLLLLHLRFGWFVVVLSQSPLLPSKWRRQKPTAINTSALSKWKPWIIQSNSDNKKQLLYKLFKQCDSSSWLAFESRSRQAQMHSDKQTQTHIFQEQKGSQERMFRSRMYLQLWILKLNLCLLNHQLSGMISSLSTCWKTWKLWNWALQ